jgi:hypothetical protein
MMSITAAQSARANKHLGQLIRTSCYGICARSQRLDQALADGCTLEAVSVRDEARERAIQREMKAMMGNGWGVPTGNDCHPLTIRYNALKSELCAGPVMTEYRMHRPDGSYWNELTKTEWEYALSLSRYPA